MRIKDWQHHHIHFLGFYGLFLMRDPFLDIEWVTYPSIEPVINSRPKDKSLITDYASVSKAGWQFHSRMTDKDSKSYGEEFGSKNTKGS